MFRSRRALWLTLGGAAVLAAGVALVLNAIKFTLMLERQAALVFEDSAAREARARLQDLERAIRKREDAALAALAALPASAPTGSIEGTVAEHPLIDAAFLLGADQGLIYPQSPGPEFATLAGDDRAPEAFLTARRLAASGAPEGSALRSLATVASAPELAGAWRLRARAGIAAVQLRAGRPGDAAATYASLEADFPEELREIVRPSRVQIAAAHSLALSLAGRRSEAQALVMATLRDLEASGAEALAEDDVGILLEKALSIASTPGDAAFRADLAPFRSRHAALLRRQRFARRVRDWIAPRLLRGGEPDRLEDPGGDRGVVAWSRVEEQRGLAAVGFLLRPAAVLAVFEEALAAPPVDGRSGAPVDTPSLALRVETPPLSGGFQELASLPGAYRGFSIGMDRVAWEGLRGSARRPFRIAAAMIAALGLFLALSAAFAVLAIRREISLARLKTEFVANVSHELKTPLSLIRLFGETLLLDRVRDPAKARGYHEIIVRESERLTHLVNNVLDFASIEAGQKKFALEPTDLGRLVEDTVTAYRLQLEERGFQVSLEIAPGLPPVEADPDAAGQALINLLDNAVKYSIERKEIAVRVERGKDRVRVAVSDRGMGISPREARRVFDTFYRSPAARRTGTRGSGLGLSLVRHILEGHGGSVELVSAPGRGSTFTLVFPARREEPAGERPVRPIPAGEQGEEGAVKR